LNVLSETKTLLDGLSIPVETGVFEGTAPETYVVIVPLTDTFELHADNAPGFDVQEARLSLFCKGNYTKTKNGIVRRLLASDFTITDRRYIERENDTGYHHYAIDVAKSYELED
jgi:hypothetical protein